ncbi:uncharacterized protein [Branchiostoma lanceolatum]|uniref:uncharacterized protein isoform X1 n=1 Tax=Branchiostoma lanceolatum TaxID=7740 RepID=UPI0034568CE5
MDLLLKLSEETRPAHESNRGACAELAHVVRGTGGIAMAVVFGLLAGGVSVLEHLVIREGVTVPQVVLAEGTGAFVLTAPFLLCFTPAAVGKSCKDIALLCLGGLLMFGAVPCGVVLSDFVPLATTQALSFGSEPVFTAIIGCIVLKEVPSYGQLLGCLACVFGTTIINVTNIKLFSNTSNLELYQSFIAAFSTSLFTSFLQVLSRYVLQRVSCLLASAYLNGVCFILAVILIVIHGDAWVVCDQVVVYLAIIAGLCAVCVMYFLRSLQLEVALVVAVVAQLRTVMTYLIQRHSFEKGRTIAGWVGVGWLLLGVLLVTVLTVRQTWKDHKRAQFLREMNFGRNLNVK